MKRYGLFFVPALVLMIIPVFPLSADLECGDSADFLQFPGDAELTEFHKDGMVFRYDEEEKGPVYLPDSIFTDEIIEMHESFNPEYMVEAVYFIEYPQDFDSEADDIILRMNELSHRVSSISGALYFSRTEQDYAVLFDDVYAVESIKNKKKIEDPEAPYPIPRKESVFLHMDEHSMGRGYYRMDYLSKENELALMITNESSMSKIITAVKPGDMKIFLVMIPCDDGLLIYGYCAVIVQNDLLVELMMDPYYSFYRRMTAMETWLYNSLHEADKLPLLKNPMP